MNSRSLVRIALLCVLPLTFTACSWIFVNEPPPNHERLNFFTCTQSRAAPGLDMVWTGVTAATAVFVLADSQYDGSGRGALAATYLGWGALTGLSAAAGFKKVNQCRDAIALLAERLNRTPDTSSLTPSPEALGWRPPQLFPVDSPLDLAPIKSPRPKQEASPGN